MTTQFRDTHFGHLARFLSGHKLLRYPDEIDPSLWRKSVPRERDGDALPKSTPAPPPPPEQGGDDLEKANDLEDPPDVPVSAKDSNVAAPEGTLLKDLHTDVSSLGGHEVFLVDWYGPDDPENPRNWPSGWKLLVSFQICFLNFAVYMGSSIYVPGELALMGEFGVGETVATLGLSLFTAGYGLGPMLWSPMSEIAVLGRNGIYFYTLLAFVLLQLPTGFAVDMPMFLVFRFLTGFFGSPCLSTGGATIADMYDPAAVAYGICIWGSFGILGPVFGPIIGGFVAPAKGWRWTIWVVTWECAAVLVMLFFLLPETSEANILYRRAKRLRKSTGDDRWRSRSEVEAVQESWKDHLTVLARAFTLTFSEPIVFAMDLYTALLYGVLFMWFESFPLVFDDIYGFDSGAQGLVFLGIFVGALVTVPLYLLWVRYGIVPKLVTGANFQPEMVLPPTFFGSVALPTCLFWYGWSARPSIHWIMPVIGSSLFTVGIVTLFFPVFNYLGISYPQCSASIFAGNALFRASFGAIFPLFARQLFRQLGIGPGNSLLAGISICFLPLPYVFYKYGWKLRQMSKNARHDV